MSANKRTILIVDDTEANIDILLNLLDDEYDILEVLKKFLSRSGRYNISTYLNPKIAVESIDDTYDVVLMDIMMPQLNGLEALKILREKNPEQDIIMMTAYSTLDKILQAHKDGAVHYLMKPFSSLQAVESKIAEILE